MSQPETPEFRRRKNAPALEACPACTKEHPAALFSQFAGERMCIFCANERQRAEDESKVAKVKAAKKSVLEKLEEEAAARDKERTENEARQARLRAVRDKRRAKKAAREEIDPSSTDQLLVEELARRELCRRHLLPFVQRFNERYDPGWVHKDICQRLEQFSLDVAEGKSPRLMLCVPPRHGKQLADSTPVLTTRGWATHGDLQVGDEVFHPSGKAIPVLAVSGKSPSEWEVELSNGQRIQCHEKHEWTVYDRSTRTMKTMETRDFVRSLRTGRPVDLMSGNRSRFQLPEVKALEFSPAELPMPPYVLGAWLGDGSRGKGCITHAAEDQPVVERIESLGYEQSARCVHKETGVVTTYFSGPRPGVAGRMLRELRELGVEHDKFIPEVYLRGSVAQRLELLAGLMDTDGHCDKNSRCRFTTADRRLADGVVDLCTTLGFRPYITIEQPKLSSSGVQGRKEYYVVGFQPTRAVPCALIRKAPTRFAAQRRVGVVAVRYNPVGAIGHCIQVDSPDGLYLAGRTLVPTHNSEIVSRNFPAWHLGRYPEHEFIACSYASDLALGFSRKVREIIRTPEYEKLFPETQLSKDSQRIDSWATTDDGGYVAAGVGGPITGRGAHILVIDDPVKNREEADSESVRRSIKDWYTSTAYTRLAPGGGILIIQTRWHDDDLAGWLLAQAAKGEGDDWEVIEYPAIATADERYRRKGEALHEARYPLSALHRIKKAVGDRDWSALYMQRPVADEGDFFKRPMFQRYGVAELPPYEQLTFYTAWDLAIGRAEQNDETFGVTVGLDVKDRLWVVDVRHGRWDAEGIVEQILDTYEVWRSDVTGIERGHIEMAIGPYLEKEITRRRLTTMYIEPLKPGRRDKQSRARPIQALMKRGMVMFRAGCDETNYLVDQMLRFPSGVHDDGVDAMAWIGQMIQGMAAVQPVRPKRKKSWRDRLNEFARGAEQRGGGHMSA